MSSITILCDRPIPRTNRPPQVAAAVDRSHGAMGELQKETLNHMFAMRQILRPDQTTAFDRAVVKALTADAR